MQKRKVGRRQYSDPDVVSLIDASGGLLDPYVVIKQAAQSVLRKLNQFDGTFSDPFERVCALASLCGYEVKPMDMSQADKEKREAVLIPTTSSNKKGIILYNPLMPRTRVIHSIGHELSHSFVPTSSVGASFRSLCTENSRGSRELETLCNHGASELTMPEDDFKRGVRRFGFGIESVDKIRREFGTSFEATLYRMAETADFPAAAGSFCFRYSKADDPDRIKKASGSLFPVAEQMPNQTPKRKYRRHSFHRSNFYPAELVMPYNKSVPETSGIYQAAKTRTLEHGHEFIPLNSQGKILPCSIEALPAPYQPREADSDWPNILFLLQARISN